MKTRGEIEAAVSERLIGFAQQYMGRGPKDIHVHLLDKLLVIRLLGVLSAAEQHLVESSSTEKGRDLVKQVRTHLIETARLQLEGLIKDATGVGVLSMHHDLSTVSDEEVLAFRLDNTPEFRESQ